MHFAILQGYSASPAIAITTAFVSCHSVDPDSPRPAEEAELLLTTSFLLLLLLSVMVPKLKAQNSHKMTGNNP